METSRREQRGRRSVLRRRRVLAASLAALALVIVIVGVMAIVRALSADATPDAGDPPPTAATPTPTSTPLTAAQELLAGSSDPAACAVSFAGDDVSEQPQLQHQGALYEALPIPRREGAVFAGWYASEADAQSANVDARVNGADLVACTDREVTLYGAWTTPEAVAAADVAVPILMYHQFTTKPEGESNSLRLNYTYIGDFDAQLGYLADQRFYLPTWDELSAFIDGRLSLPPRSVIITDDDADSTWLELAVPVVDAHRLLTTSFVITKWRSEPSPSPFVLQRSHTHDMHEAGANGKGRMVNWSEAQIAADMETSAQILGAKQVMAYPFGHYNDTAKQGLRDAGFEMARTIDHGYVRAGTDKLALPTIRINYGMSLSEFIAEVG